MFANGTEFETFLETCCYRCTKYADYDDLEKGKIMCPIDEQITTCSFTGKESDFPYNDLKPVDRMCRYVCKSFNSDDEHLMKCYREIFKIK